MAELGPINPCANWRHFKQHFDSLTDKLAGIETLRLPDDFGIRVDIFRIAVPEVVFEVPTKPCAGLFFCHWCAFESNTEGWIFDTDNEDEELEVFDL